MKSDDIGLVHISSSRPVLDTLSVPESTVSSRGLPIVARIDHAGDAAKASLTMRPAELLIFGNAVSGTPLMVASPTVGIDLPLKVPV